MPVSAHQELVYAKVSINSGKPEMVVDNDKVQYAELKHLTRPSDEANCDDEDTFSTVNGEF